MIQLVVQRFICGPNLFVKKAIPYPNDCLSAEQIYARGQIKWFCSRPKKKNDIVLVVESLGVYHISTVCIMLDCSCVALYGSCLPKSLSYSILGICLYMYFSCLLICSHSNVTSFVDTISVEVVYLTRELNPPIRLFFVRYLYLLVASHLTCV